MSAPRPAGGNGTEHVAAITTHGNDEDTSAPRRGTWKRPEQKRRFKRPLSDHQPHRPDRVGIHAVDVEGFGSLAAEVDTMGNRALGSGMIGSHEAEVDEISNHAEEMGGIAEGMDGIGNHAAEINEISNHVAEGYRIGNLAAEGNRIGNLAAEGNRIGNLASESDRIGILAAEDNRISNLEAEGNGICNLAAEGNRIGNQEAESDSRIGILAAEGDRIDSHAAEVDRAGNHAEEIVIIDNHAAYVNRNGSHAAEIDRTGDRYGTGAGRIVGRQGEGNIPQERLPPSAAASTRTRRTEAPPRHERSMEVDHVARMARLAELVDWSDDEFRAARVAISSRHQARDPASRGQMMEGSDGVEMQSQAGQADSITLRDKNDFIQNVSQFFNQQDISDVVLKVGENSYFAHRFVLAKSSEVFRTMLYDKRYQQAAHPEIVLEESEECQHHFEAFLKFLYTAEVLISTDSAVGILCLADKYCVMSLKALCTRYMVENTQSPRVRNALNWYSWAKALHMDELIDSCSKTIAWNMELLVALPEWLSMDIDFLADIISNPQLVVSNEYVLYSAVEQWLLHDSHLPDLKENGKKLLRLVRFPQMMVQQLYKVEKGELASREGSQDEIEKLLNEAFRFRSLCPFQSELDIQFSDEFYRPRNYKDLTVDTVRMQNTLRFGIQVDVRTYVGPVPSTIREGEWKITYRKANDSWTLQVYCHESAMVNGEARIQAVLLISDDDDRVLQVEASEETVCSRGNHLTMVFSLPACDQAKLLTVLIKPLPN